MCRHSADGELAERLAAVSSPWRSAPFLWREPFREGAIVISGMLATAATENQEWLSDGSSKSVRSSKRATLLVLSLSLVVSTDDYAVI